MIHEGVLYLSLLLDVDARSCWTSVFSSFDSEVAIEDDEENDAP